MSITYSYDSGTDTYTITNVSSDINKSIIATRFNTLKSIIESKCAKRRWVNPVSQFSNINFDTTPDTGVIITNDHFNKLRTPLNTINSNDFSALIDNVQRAFSMPPSSENNKILDETLLALEARVETLTDNMHPTTQAASGCNAVCTGTCMTTCEEVCSSCRNDCGYGCGNSCSGYCYGTCYSDCTNGCLADCSSKCQDLCLGICGWSCSSGCTGACSNQCSSNCYLTCDNNCGGGCLSGCGTGCASDGCAIVCQGGCSSQCIDVCKSYCSGSCTEDCTAGCANTCSGTSKY